MIDPWRPVAVALERERIAFRPLPLRQHRVDLGMVGGGQAQIRMIARLAGRGAAIARTDDDRGDLRPVEHRAAGDRRDVDAVAVGDRCAALRSSSWNSAQPPKSSMISLYLVSERFSKGGCGSGLPSQAIAEEAARHRAVAQQMHVVARGRARPARSPAAHRAANTAPAC